MPSSRERVLRFKPAVASIFSDVVPRPTMLKWLVAGGAILELTDDTGCVHRTVFSVNASGLPEMVLAPTLGHDDLSAWRDAMTRVEELLCADPEWIRTATRLKRRQRIT